MPLYPPATTDTGTIILDGLAMPTSGVGVDGNYYLDSDDHILYGPKATAGWGSAQYGLPTTTPTETSPSGGYELGNRYDFHIPVQIVGLRFWRGASSSLLTRKLRLWNNAGTLVAETADTVETAGVGGYIEAMFPTPVIAVDEARYTCSYSEPSGQFQWNTVTPTNPNAAAVTFVDGVYGTSLGGFPPNSQGAGIDRFCDPIYREESSDIWPVAIEPLSGAEGPEGPEGPAGADAVANDASYDSSWNGATDAPSRNAVYDWAESAVVVSGVQVSQPSGSPWLPTNAILESYPRFQSPTTGQTVLTSGTIRVFPIGILRKGHTATGLGFIAAVAAAGITNSWVGICTVDRVVRAVSATSTAATNSNAGRTFTFAASYTPSVDTYVFGFIMYQATTVPSMYGCTQTVQVAPVVNGNSDASQTTPPAVDATLGTLVSQPTLAYIWLTGTT